MEIRILVFGAAREMLGSGSVTVQAVAGTTAGKLMEQLRATYPALQKLSSFALAVNQYYATADTVIKAGDEVAIIPPVSGG
jgi:molybdopterin converting factor subunit 1